MSKIFERFTDRARRVIVLAQEESRKLQHAYIGTEHLLMGLVLEKHGIAAQELAKIGLTPETIQGEVIKIIGVGDGTPGYIPFNPEAKKALELSLREALRLGQNYIGVEHLLLGLIRVDDANGADKIFADVNADLPVIKALVEERATAADPHAAQKQAATTSPDLEEESAEVRKQAMRHIREFSQLWEEQGITGWIVIVGSLASGLQQIHGPFLTEVLAGEWVNRQAWGEARHHVNIVPVQKPT